MKTTTALGFVILGTCVALLTGCAHTVPSELVNARAAYQRVSNGPAARLVPAEVHKAKVALAAAERSYEDDAGSYQTRDLAYVAHRKSQIADALGGIAADQHTGETAKAAFSSMQGDLLDKSKADLSDSKADLSDSKRDLNDAKADLTESEAALAQARAELMLALAKLAAVREDDRGIIITLQDDVLFKSGKSYLLPQAQVRLDQVGEALMSNNNRKIVVEGHTDSNGSDAYNKRLSQQRADAVRGYLVKRGHPAHMILATGMGESAPVADNGTPEGRANNRRVDIIIHKDRFAGGN